jgi:hypothetical protein
VDHPVGVRPPEANGGTDSDFSNLDRLGPDRADRGPCGTVDRPSLDRTGPSSILYVGIYLMKSIDGDTLMIIEYMTFTIC